MVHVVRSELHDLVQFYSKMAIVTQKHLSYKQPGKTKLPQEDKKGATYCGKSRNMGFSIGCQLSERQKDDGKFININASNFLPCLEAFNKCTMCSVNHTTISLRIICW
ncbi:hypothetical protein ACOSQ3_001430 [Xanthoceras sorbifolium]